MFRFTDLVQKDIERYRYLQLNTSQTQVHSGATRQITASLLSTGQWPKPYGIIKQACIGNLINQSVYPGCEKRTRFFDIIWVIHG